MTSFILAFAVNNRLWLEYRTCLGYSITLGPWLPFLPCWVKVDFYWRTKTFRYGTLLLPVPHEVRYSSFGLKPDTFALSLMKRDCGLPLSLIRRLLAHLRQRQRLLLLQSRSLVCGSKFFRIGSKAEDRSAKTRAEFPSLATATLSVPRFPTAVPFPPTGKATGSKKLVVKTKGTSDK